MASIYDTLDRHFTTTARSFALVSFTVSIICDCVFMILLQFVLLKAHNAKKNLKSPRPLEIYIVVTLLWTFHWIFDSTINSLTIFGISFLLSPNEKDQYRDLRAQYHRLEFWLHDSVKPSSCDGLRLLFFQILATWLISQGIILVFYSVIPLLHAIWWSPQRVIQKLYSRGMELLDILKEINRKPLIIPYVCSEKCPGEKLSRTGMETTHAISFRRHQTHDPGAEERILDWDLTIEKSALDEMKEILGPPGGFGELGFNVAEDRVFFGAMGVKTRYVTR